MEKLKLICNPLSAFSSRVLIALAYKKIPFDIEYYDHERDSETLKEINPLGTVPVVILEDGTIIYESMAILELLDTLPVYHSTIKIFPSDPIKRVQVKMNVERLDALTTRLGPAVRKGAQEGLTGINKGVQVFRDILGENQFLTGEQFGVTDICIFPFVDRLCTFPEIKERLYEDPGIKEWYETILSFEAVQDRLGRIRPEDFHSAVRNDRAGKNPVIWPPRDLI
mmetsp:Transcript_58304/g.66526  ORF Transcript_58304/g.66526 Transcript_58304/m.66526 type:complete len:225 (-) Transcript_58304:71-745(-)